MNKIAILLLGAASATALVVGCGDDTTSATTTSNTTSSSSSSSSSGAGGGGNTDLGKMPKYGAVQMDRFGRPAINTALNHVADLDAAAKGKAKDAWNADSTPANWGKNFAGEVAKNLAVLDALDGMCGNQMLAEKPASATTYQKLAGVLADDRQWLNTAGAMCTSYLAVEGNFLGMANTDCGGRALNYDVIDISYSLLAVGAPAGVTDGVAVPAGAQGKSFPYLAPPLP